MSAQPAYYGNPHADFDRSDAYDPADYGVWNEFSGEYYPIRSAGDRYTGPRRDFIDSRFFEGDALAALHIARRQMLRKLDPPASLECQQWHREVMSGHYQVARLRAMSLSGASGILMAERKAIDSRLHDGLNRVREYTTERGNF